VNLGPTSGLVEIASSIVNIEDSSNPEGIDEVIIPVKTVEPMLFTLVFSTIEARFNATCDS